MIVTGTFTTCQVDKARRRIVGLVVPFGEIGNAALGGIPSKLVFEAGSLTWDDPNQVKLVVDHNGDRPVMAGKARDLVETEAGIIGTFMVSTTGAGNDALVEASDGLRTGLSVEAEIPDSVTPNDDGVYTVTAADPGRLHRVALVENPAFRSAQITEVAASQPKGTTVSNTPVEAAEVPDEALAATIESLTTAVGTLQAAMSAATVGDNGVADPAAAPAAASATRTGTQVSASTTVTKEAFPYGHPGAEGRSFFYDLTCARSDDQAAARVRKAEAMWVQAANEPVVKSNTFIPNTYESAYIGQLNFPRVIADSMPATSVTSSRPVVIPKFTSAFADGGSGEPVAAHSEGTNPAQGELVIGSVTATPAPSSGLFDVTREAVDAADPVVDGVIMSALQESYAQVTEALAVTALLATSGAATASSTTNADLEIEARNMQKVLRKEIAKFYATRGAGPDIIFYAPEQFNEAVAADVATGGVPLYPEFNPTNSQSAITDYGIYGPIISVLRTPGVNAPKLTAAKVVIARLSDLHRWESPLLTFKWEEVAGPAKIRFACFGYAVFAGMQGKGVTIVTQS